MPKERPSSTQEHQPTAMKEGREKEMRSEEEKIKIAQHNAARRNMVPPLRHRACGTELELDGHSDWAICPKHGRLDKLVLTEEHPFEQNPRHEEEYERLVQDSLRKLEEEEKKRDKDAKFFELAGQLKQYSVEACPRCKGSGQFTNILGQVMSCDHKAR